MKQIAILFLCIVAIYSCNEKSSLGPSKTCQISRSDFESTISISQIQFPFEFWQGASKDIQDQSYYLGLANKNKNILTQTEIRNTLEFLKFQDISEFNNSQIITSVFFSSINYSDNPNAKLSFDDLLGISIYFVVNKHLKVRIYKKNNNGFESVNELTSEVGQLPILDFYKTALLLKGKSRDISALVVSPKSIEKKQLKSIMKNSGNDFSHKLNLYFDNSLSLKDGSIRNRFEDMKNHGGQHMVVRDFLVMELPGPMMDFVQKSLCIKF